MNRVARTYLVFVIAVAAAYLLGQQWHGLIALDKSAWFAALAFIGLGVLAEVSVFWYNIGKGRAAVSIAFVPLLAGIILLPHPAYILIGLAVYPIAQIGLQRRPLIRAGFNTAQVVLALTLASLVYTSLGGVPARTESLTAFNFAAMSGTFFFVNHLLVSIAVSLLQAERFSQTFVRTISTSGSNVLYDVLVSPITLLVVFLYARLHLWGLMLVVLPMMLVRHSYLAYQQLLQTNRDLLRVLVKAIETRDPYTSGHSVRVSQLAKAIAEDMGLGPGRVDEIETAALVHDIGKVDSIYADIILKGSSLTEAERRVIVTHAAKGAEFLRTLASFRPYVIAAVRHHHERFDGTGYPDRLSGEDIPLPARIIMICDSIDAMLSDRPYRKALSIEQVRAELLRCSGSQFDPKIVNVILQRGTLEKAAGLITPPARQVPRLSVAV
jgi:putative nucleotidyltransferase with HDIG domain